MVLLKERNRVLIEGHEVDITHPDKMYYPKKKITKLSYIQYLIDVSAYLLPFLKDRVLTAIRYPRGVEGESFYQKSCPEYAPDFIKTYLHEDIEYIVVSDLATLVWLGNQGALDLHIPFNSINSSYPSEIVFDLDPPRREDFILAVEAAIILKDILDRLEIPSFIKTSGNKGLQVYIPLPEATYTYEDTRKFTEFIANYLVKIEPKWFTIERIKKNRGNRLYVDYLQHAAGKTLIAPYSARGNEEASVATPLFWHEVTRSLKPSAFTIDNLPERIRRMGCPFADFFNTKTSQSFDRVLEGLILSSQTSKTP
ncbi:non-homologous end-joining DNA ligase [Alkaliphilus serpentinus]|nr:non-homologous end-joining DNA ligase [Alkaliphilus serpentinus]